MTSWITISPPFGSASGSAESHSAALSAVRILNGLSRANSFALDGGPLVQVVRFHGNARLSCKDNGLGIR